VSDRRLQIRISAAIQKFDAFILERVNGKAYGMLNEGEAPDKDILTGTAAPALSAVQLLICLNPE